MSIIRQLYITVIGSLIVILICTTFLIVPSCEKLFENSKLRKIDEDRYSASSDEYNKINIELDKYLYTGGQWEFQQQLMELVSLSCFQQKAKLGELSSYSDTRDDVSHHKVYEIKLLGSFSNLMRVINSIQNQLLGGAILSIQFYEEIDRRTKKKNVVALLYVESISYKHVSR